jgi:hypothetical protein
MAGAAAPLQVGPPCLPPSCSEQTGLGSHLHLVPCVRSLLLGPPAGPRCEPTPALASRVLLLPRRFCPLLQAWSLPCGFPDTAAPTSSKPWPPVYCGCARTALPGLLSPSSRCPAAAVRLLQGLLATLEAGEGAGAASEGGSLDHTAMTLRGFAYQAVGILAGRLPEVLSGRVDVAHSFFSGAHMPHHPATKLLPHHPATKLLQAAPVRLHLFLQLALPSPTLACH